MAQPYSVEETFGVVESHAVILFEITSHVEDSVEAKLLQSL